MFKIFNMFVIINALKNWFTINRCKNFINTYINILSEVTEILPFNY